MNCLLNYNKSGVKAENDAVPCKGEDRAIYTSHFPKLKFQHFLIFFLNTVILSLETDNLKSTGTGFFLGIFMDPVEMVHRPEAGNYS